MRPSHYWLRYGLPAWQAEHARKYSPNQPRVPAGSPDGGQWTSSEGSGNHSTGDGPSKFVLDKVLLADASHHARSSELMNDANPEPIILGARYAEVAVSRYDRTGDPRIDKITGDLMQALARAHTAVGEGAGPLYGAAVHFAFAAEVRKLNIPGISVEQSFSLGDTASYGLDGSIRTDVAFRDPELPNSRPRAIWDVKTGTARLSGARVREIRDQVGVGSDVPIFELHIDRGITKKGRAIPIFPRWLIAARLWG